MKDSKRKSRFPVRTSFIVGMTIVWNLLLIPYFSDFFSESSEPGFSIEKSLLPLLFVFIVAILTLVSNGFQKIVLKEGRSVNKIKPFVYIVLILMVVMILMNTLLFTISS